MIRLIASKKDKAGMNIAEECEKIGLDVFYVEEDILFVKNLPKADSYIFLSRHKSASGKPTLSAHFPGNFSEDTSYGGNSKELGFSFPSLEKIFIKNMFELKNGLENYQLVLEATHHGPTHFEKPVLFVEIGSTKKQWCEKEPAILIANVINKTLSKIKNNKFKTAVAFGGTHYPKKFTKLLIESDYSIGHICPKYQRENLDKDIINQMIQKSCEKIDYCLIDEKGINRKSEIIKWFQEKQIKVIRV